MPTIFNPRAVAVINQAMSCYPPKIHLGRATSYLKPLSIERCVNRTGYKDFVGVFYPHVWRRSSRQRRTRLKKCQHLGRFITALNCIGYDVEVSLALMRSGQWKTNYPGFIEMMGGPLRSWVSSWPNNSLVVVTSGSGRLFHDALQSPRTRTATLVTYAGSSDWLASNYAILSYMDWNDRVCDRMHMNCCIPQATKAFDFTSGAGYPKESIALGHKCLAKQTREQGIHEYSSRVEVSRYYYYPDTWKNDVTMQYPSAYDAKKHWRGPHGRTLLASFVGSPTHCSRRDLMDYWKDKDHTGLKVIPTVYERGAYSAILQRSRYCLVLDGHYPWTIRFLDVLQHGCVPVVVSLSWHPPLRRLLDWNSAIEGRGFPTVLVHPRLIRSLDVILARINEGTWLKMQAPPAVPAVAESTNSEKAASAPAPPRLPESGGGSSGSTSKPSQEESTEPAVIAMLENPAEDALPRAAVVDIFAQHDLKVVWANEDHAWHDCENASVLVTVKRRVDASMLATLPKLRLVAVAFTGYDHVDLEACRQRGVNVANVPGYSTDGAAELCFGLIFSLLRHIPMAHQHVRSGKWSWPPGNELCGRRLGIVGTGAMGLRVAEIGKAFRVSNVIGYDPVKNDRFSAIGGEYVQSLATIFLHSDIIVIACALTAASKGMVNRRMLKLLRPDSILINCARGAIIDQKALTEMLQEGRFRAGLDVYEGHEGEELPSNHPLRSALWDVLRRCGEAHENQSAQEAFPFAAYPVYFGEDFLGAAVFTLAAASLQGRSLLEREAKKGSGELWDHQGICMGLAAQNLDEAAQRRLQQTVLERTLRRLDQTGEEMAAKAPSQSNKKQRDCSFRGCPVGFTHVQILWIPFTNSIFKTKLCRKASSDLLRKGLLTTPKDWPGFQGSLSVGRIINSSSLP
ncbi:serA [Symbiodinium pilosum]|uniref:SerA protein n=1 Tax=Symbiodinium pilosum TaxID=2952 RepID=A0A812XAR3_SYMPI|nr:serA [Symbiodinium pilosum]